MAEALPCDKSETAFGLHGVGARQGPEERRRALTQMTHKDTPEQ